jgi:2-C-methyl-D-erythritol 4-phosphate cytidylyltransferase
MAEKFYAIVTAGGSGSRIGGKTVKQFLEIGGKPILVHTLNNFLALPFPVQIILVLPAGFRDYWNRYCFENNYMFPHIAVTGGITRFHSVKNALKYVERGGVVAVHDGVRPFADTEFIEKMFNWSKEFPAVVPAVKPADSVRRISGDKSNVINREELVMIQTPQVFSSDILIDSYNCAYRPEFTDDASVVEAAGNYIKIVEGRKINFKITEPQDLLLAGGIINAS